MSTWHVRAHNEPTTNTNIIVRSGGKEWTVPRRPIEPLSLSANKLVTHSSVTSAGVGFGRRRPMVTHAQGAPRLQWKTLLEPVRWGGMLGLLVTCFCVVGIHAARLPAHRAKHVAPASVHPVSKPVVQPRHVLAGLGAPLLIPAVRLYGLFWSPPSNQYTASSNRATHWRLVRVAAYSSDLLQYKMSAAPIPHPQWRIRPVFWNVHPVNTLSTTPPGAAMRVSTWLTAEVSAMNALIASIADGAPGRDAWTAFRAARMETPQAKVVNETGLAIPISTIGTAVQRAFVDVAHQETIRALADLTVAVRKLQTFQ